MNLTHLLKTLYLHRSRFVLRFYSNWGIFIIIIL